MFTKALPEEDFFAKLTIYQKIICKSDISCGHFPVDLHNSRLHRNRLDGCLLDVSR